MQNNNPWERGSNSQPIPPSAYGGARQPPPYPLPNLPSNPTSRANNVTISTQNDQLQYGRGLPRSSTTVWPTSSSARPQVQRSVSVPANLGVPDHQYLTLQAAPSQNQVNVHHASSGGFVPVAYPQATAYSQPHPIRQYASDNIPPQAVYRPLGHPGVPYPNSTPMALHLMAHSRPRSNTFPLSMTPTSSMSSMSLEDLQARRLQLLHSNIEFKNKVEEIEKNIAEKNAEIRQLSEENLLMKEMIQEAKKLSEPKSHESSETMLLSPTDISERHFSFDKVNDPSALRDRDMSANLSTLVGSRNSIATNSSDASGPDSAYETFSRGTRRKSSGVHKKLPIAQLLATSSEEETPE